MPRPAFPRRSIPPAARTLPTDADVNAVLRANREMHRVPMRARDSIRAINRIDTGAGRVQKRPHPLDENITLKRCCPPRSCLAAFAKATTYANDGAIKSDDVVDRLPT